MYTLPHTYLCWRVDKQPFLHSGNFGPDVMSSDDSDNGPSGSGRLRRRPASFRPSSSSRRLGSSGSFGQITIPEIPESSEDHGSASSNEPTRPSIATSSNSAELRGGNVQSNDPKNMFLEGAMLTESPVSSPSPSDDLRLFSSSQDDPSVMRGTLSRPRAVKKSSLLSNVTSASDYSIIDDPTPSRRRWDELRQHFLPQLLSSHAPDPRSSSIPPPALQAPPRPSTPKQFRIPKLGFKQTVEQAQEPSADRMSKFADDILRTSRAVRSVESKAQRREREGTLTSFTNMSFMSSNASLGLSMPSSYLPPSRAKPIQRPPSLQSTAGSYPPPATPTSLYQVVSYYASITPGQQRSTIVLPHENEVLLTLSLPFLSVRSENTLNEQLQSIDAFEIIVKTWRATSELVAY